MATSRSTLAVLAALTLLASAARLAAAEGAFLNELEDLPLPPGLHEMPGGTLFDSPSGRIVDVTAQGDVGPERVSAFYAQTLPELGWQKVGPSAYRRDNELLKIDMDSSHRPLTVRFSVVPQ